MVLTILVTVNFSFRIANSKVVEDIFFAKIITISF